MLTAQQRLAKEIQLLVADLPSELVVAVALALTEASRAGWQRMEIQALGAVTQPGARERLGEFLDFWHQEAGDVGAQEVALALIAAAEVCEHHRRRQRLELVWTGPDSPLIPLRRTDQALLQLINEAQESVHIVSFVVYKVKTIAQAIVRAAQRGVSVAIYLETPASSSGKVDLDTIGALGQEVASHAQLYVWPLDQRPRTADGRHGSLHAKVAVADSRKMLISSANLTEYAMTLNIEMGIIIDGGPLPSQVEQHLQRLVEQGVFRPARIS